MMELCKGNLRNHFKSNPISVPVVSGERKDVRQAFKWVTEISSALDYIHHEKVVHRDLKLEKILVRNREKNKPLFVLPISVSENCVILKHKVIL